MTIWIVVEAPLAINLYGLGSLSPIEGNKGGTALRLVTEGSSNVPGRPDFYHDARKRRIPPGCSPAYTSRSWKVAWVLRLSSRDLYPILYRTRPASYLVSPLFTHQQESRFSYSADPAI